VDILAPAVLRARMVQMLHGMRAIHKQSLGEQVWFGGPQQSIWERYDRLHSSIGVRILRALIMAVF